MNVHAIRSRPVSVHRRHRQAVARPRVVNVTDAAFQTFDQARLRSIATVAAINWRASSTCTWSGNATLSNVDGPRVESPTSPLEQRFSSTRLISRGRYPCAERRLRREG